MPSTPREKESGTFEEHLDRLQQHLIVEKGLSRNTLAAYLSDLCSFKDFLQQANLSSFLSPTPDHIARYLAKRRELGVAASTSGRELVSIKALYRFLRDEGILIDDPSERISPPSEEARTARRTQSGGGRATSPGSRQGHATGQARRRHAGNILLRGACASAKWWT